MEAVIKEEPIEPSQFDEHSSGHNTSDSTEQNSEVENRSIKTEETDSEFHALLSFLDYWIYKPSTSGHSEEKPRIIEKYGKYLIRFSEGAKDFLQIIVKIQILWTQNEKSGLLKI